MAGSEVHGLRTGLMRLGGGCGCIGCKLPRGLQDETEIGKKKEEAGREQEVRIGPVLPADG
jgi:hypothetical protein